MKVKERIKDNVKQHYVPKFYLRNFTDTNYLFAHDIYNHKSFKSNLKNIGSEKYFYDIDVNLFGMMVDVNSSITETFVDDSVRLQNEELCIPIIDNFQTVCNILKESDTGGKNPFALKFQDNFESQLIDFILIQFVRTKKYRKHFDSMAESFVDVMSEYELTDEVIQLEDKNYVMSYLHNIHLYAALSLCDSSEDIYLSELFHNIYEYYLDVLKEFKNNLENATTFFIYNKTSKYFMTSDNPVCIHTNGNEIADFQIVYLPLTSDISVVFLNQDLKEYSYLNQDIQIIKEDNISILENFNLFVTKNADQRIFSYLEDFEQIEKFVKGDITMQIKIPE